MEVAVTGKTGVRTYCGSSIGKLWRGEALERTAGFASFSVT